MSGNLISEVYSSTLCPSVTPLTVLVNGVSAVDVVSSCSDILALKKMSKESRGASQGSGLMVKGPLDNILLRLGELDGRHAQSIALNKYNAQMRSYRRPLQQQSRPRESRPPRDKPDTKQDADLAMLLQDLLTKVAAGGKQKTQRAHDATRNSML